MIITAVELKPVFNGSLYIGTNVKAVCIFAALHQFKAVEISLIAVVYTAAFVYAAVKLSCGICKLKISAVGKGHKIACITVLKIDINKRITCFGSGGRALFRNGNVIICCGSPPGSCLTDHRSVKSCTVF